ncbi:MAG: CotH kinase family protein [Alistipes sp.]|nr:CotH kinase family protein [Alistipes sp.]
MKRVASYIFTLLLCVLCLVACTEDQGVIFPDWPNSGNTDTDDDKDSDDGDSDDKKEDEGGDDDNQGSDNGGETGNGDYPNTSWAVGELDWVFDMNNLPEIHIEISQNEWNDLLKAYDKDNNTNTYVHCDVEYKSKGETHNFVDAGLRLRGNTSRRRPEGNGGEMHITDNTDWHHCHFMINLRKYQKDDAHELHNVRKLHLKWHKDDRAYCRELYCYDLFRRFGIWTAPYSSYCRLWIHVEGDSEPAYYGIYEQIEAIDDKFVKKRKELFGDHKHNLWKCRWGADLNYNNIGHADICFDDDSGANHTYELKSNTENFSAAKAQLIEFTKNVTQRTGQDFHDWIASVCDVRLLLRTYAVNVVVGMWDDYWNNKNNYYIYFNSSDKNNYKFFFIPFDYDNTLGTSLNCGVQSDSGRHDPLNWGNTDESPLIGKLLKYEDYYNIYVEALNELIDPANDLFYYQHSINRITGWHAMIRDYVVNDTEEDCEIKDRPAGWGNIYDYRILDAGSSMNFFKVKAESIPKR